VKPGSRQPSSVRTSTAMILPSAMMQRNLSSPCHCIRTCCMHTCTYVTREVCLHVYAAALHHSLTDNHLALSVLPRGLLNIQAQSPRTGNVDWSQRYLPAGAPSSSAAVMAATRPRPLITDASPTVFSHAEVPHTADHLVEAQPDQHKQHARGCEDTDGQRQRQRQTCTHTGTFMQTCQHKGAELGRARVSTYFVSMVSQVESRVVDTAFCFLHPSTAAAVHYDWCVAGAHEYVGVIER
jgi:hypothetical protein